MSHEPVVSSFLISDDPGIPSSAHRLFTSLYLALLVTTVLRCASQNKLDSDQVVTLIHQYIGATSKSDFVAAAKLFEYPPSYSAQQLNEDIAAVAKNVSLAQSETGTISLPNGESNGVYMVVGFGGGNIKYWGQGPKATSFTYRALFADGTEGQVSFEVVPTSDGLRLRQVKYGFPSTAAGADRAKSLYTKIAQGS